MRTDPPCVAHALSILRPLRLAGKRALDHHEARALETIYRSYAEMLLGVARRMMATDSDAEDVLHEVFCRLPWILAQYRGGGLGGWLKRVTQRQALMELRRVRRRREECLAEEADSGGSEVSNLASDCGDTLHRALASLAEPLRDVVVLRVCYDFSHRQIADALGISPTASEVRLCRAIKRLRTALWQSRPAPLRRSA